jgi:hypothetical protein
MIKYAYERFLKGDTIFTNLGLKFSAKNKNIHELDKKFFENYAESKFDIRNALILIDEAHVFVDSRNAMTKKNKLFSKFITQSRKRSVDLLYTTQDKNPEFFLASGQVELRLRKMTDYIVFCESIKVDDEMYIIQKWCDSYGCLIKEPISYLASPFYPLYDTDEIIDFDND